ncbi:MAG: transketolase [Gallionellales bacterium RIFCSPLOWO2_12_FULL_59_22]|nr:MAG: transketolase [Gallionellales bacterium RIFCSPLOWO2_12_FULL_59_22]
MRKACLDAVHMLARHDPRVVFIGSDLGPGVLEGMKKELPERYFMEGISEANVIGMAAGLAMDGYIPYVNTIATFITRRGFEQVALDVCLHHLPVRLIGNGGGVVYAPLGPTHLAVDDFALMRVLPNMTVMAASDADEMRRLMEQSLDWPDPIYIRLAKGVDKIISKEANGFAIGKAIPMRMAAAANSVLFATTGVMTTNTLAAAEALAAKGIDSTVLHFHTIKPLDVAALLAYTAKAKAIVTVEEHSLIGGFGSAIIEVLTDNLVAFPPVKRLGLSDAFSKYYGTQNDLLEANGLMPQQIAETTEQFLNRL